MLPTRMQRQNGVSLCLPHECLLHCITSKHQTWGCFPTDILKNIVYGSLYFFQPVSTFTWKYPNAVSISKEKKQTNKKQERSRAANDTCEIPKTNLTTKIIGG